MRIQTVILVLCLLPTVAAEGVGSSGVNLSLLPETPPAPLVPLCDDDLEPAPGTALVGTLVEDCFELAKDLVEYVLQQDPHVICTPARVGRTDGLPFFGVNPDEECIEDLQEIVEEKVQDPVGLVPNIMVYIED